MEQTHLHELLVNLTEGRISLEEVEQQLKTAPFTDLGYAKVDNHRAIRQGVAEVIYGEGKTVDQIRGIARSMIEAGQKSILVTRLPQEHADDLKSDFDLTYHKLPRVGIIGSFNQVQNDGTIVVAAAGTSDLAVAEEAALTAEFLGNNVTRLYDVGVAGIHRLLSHADDIASAEVIIAVAGMEGALPSVVAGIADCPVIAVPTSVGYGASLGGIAALLAMLNSCASGVSVVNIDNGFGAGYQAAMINRKRS